MCPRARGVQHQVLAGEVGGLAFAAHFGEQVGAVVEGVRVFGLGGVDGGCPGVKSVKQGIIGATSQQYPLLMASLGVQAVVDFAKTGKKPEKTPGLDFFDTGVQLITDKPVPGLPSKTSEEGLKLCWG